MSHNTPVTAVARVPVVSVQVTARCGDDSVARTVSVGQHLSTSYPVVTVTLVIDVTQECGGHSADYAETNGRILTSHIVQKTVEVPQIQFLS